MQVAGQCGQANRKLAFLLMTFWGALLISEGLIGA